MTKKIIGIACIADNKAIGYENELIFLQRDDLKHFSKITTYTELPDTRNAVLMGRKTYESLPGLLKNRINCIISQTLPPRNEADIIIDNSIRTLLNILNKRVDVEAIYIIGGEGIYSYFNNNNLFDKLILTVVNYPKIDYGDSFFPNINMNDYNSVGISTKFARGLECRTGCEVDMAYSIHTLVKRVQNPIINSIFSMEGEYGYLKILKRIVHSGAKRTTRNSMTRSIFGVKMDFDISKSFPLITTKKMYLKGVLKELIWFIQANTNSKDLEKDKVQIWKGNSTREYLDSIGLTGYTEGECGPIYGFQWRHFNAKYRGCDGDYIGEGIDQLQNIIDLIRTNPTSRRMFMSAWNPEQMGKMALPPCHISYQFYVRVCSITNIRYLDCAMYQRSGDIFLGVPFNIASTAALTYIIANITKIIPGKITIVIGDAHIYEHHIEQAKLQLSRHPKPFPQMTLDRNIESIDDIAYDDFTIHNYKFHPTIRASMTP